MHRSAGCIVFEMVNLRKAFGQVNIKDLYEAICDYPVSHLEKSYQLEPVIKLSVKLFCSKFLTHTFLFSFFYKKDLPR